MEQYIPLIISALGGTVLGPIISRLAGGTGTSGALGGLIGGAAAHFGANAAGLGPLLGDSAMMGHIQSLLEGGVGGGLLGAIAGFVMKKS